MLDIYNAKYGPIINEYLDDSSTNNNNDFFNHIFGKQQKTQQNEVELYLKVPWAESNQNILLWWKVYI